MGKSSKGKRAASPSTGMTPEQAFRSSKAILRAAVEAGDSVAIAEVARRKANRSVATV